jgi:hypothetical protein
MTKALISEREIYAAACVMIKRFGEDAAAQAARRANEFAAGNSDGKQAWLRIMQAIEQMQRTRTPEEAVN